MTGPPGYPSPRRRATLSYASPAASSTVWPSSRYRASPSTDDEHRVAARDDEHRERQLARPGSWSHAACRCASRWFTPTYGTSSVSAIAFAALTPTSSAPARPGTVARGDRVDVGERHARLDQRLADHTAHELEVGAARDLGHDAAEARRADRPGSTTTLERMSWPSTTTAAAVSSQLVSMPRTFTRAGSVVGRRAARARRAARRAPACRCPRTHITTASSVGPDVVALAHALGHEAEPPVQRLRAACADPHLERQRVVVPVDRLVGERDHQARADVLAVPLRVDRDRRDVRLVGRHHQPGVADDVAVHTAPRSTRARPAARAPTGTARASTGGGTPAARSPSPRGGASCAAARSRPIRASEAGRSRVGPGHRASHAISASLRRR